MGLKCELIPDYTIFSPPFRLKFETRYDKKYDLITKWQAKAECIYTHKSM